MTINEQVGSIGRCMSILYRHAQAHISKQLRPFNIGSGQFSLLLVLETKNGAMQDELSSIMQLDKANVARAITKLEKEEYVHRELDTQDKRIWRIYLTDKGAGVLPVIKKVLSDWNESVSSGLDQNQKAMLSIILNKMAENAGHNWHQAD